MVEAPTITCYLQRGSSYFIVVLNTDMRSWRLISKLLQSSGSHKLLHGKNRSITSCAQFSGFDIHANETSFQYRNQPPRQQPQPQIIIRRSYGSRTCIELEEQDLPKMDAIKPYMRPGLNGSHGISSETEFVVCFLGTGGGAPTRHRLGSCTALRLGGQTFLFDITEGTLRQMEYSAILPSSVTKIFISHLHGDHLFGLVPVILGIMVSHKLRMSGPPSKKQRKHLLEHGEKPTLEIFGPPGLYNYINMVLTLSMSKVNYLNINVIELVGGRMERGPMSSRPTNRGARNIFLSHYPETEMPLIKRSYLEPNKDGVWVIDAPEPITKELIETSDVGMGHVQDGFKRLPNDVNLGLGRRLHIRAAELDHLAGVQTFGYTVEEQKPPSTIDVIKAKAMGVKPGKKYGLLKCGLTVPTDDGTGEVLPEQVCIKSFAPRKIAILSDHRMVPKPMAQLCKNADLLVHEATLSKADGVAKMKMRGHTTAYNAGLFGREMGCKVVALNHFGSASTGKDFVSKIVSEAREGNADASQIIASYDLLEVWIPRGGFDFKNSNDIANLKSEIGSSDEGVGVTTSEHVDKEHEAGYHTSERQEDLSLLLVAQLKERLREKNLSVSGNKKELIDRLKAHR